MNLKVALPITTRKTTWKHTLILSMGSTICCKPDNKLNVYVSA
jgi:hypothetical protein